MKKIRKTIQVEENHAKLFQTAIKNKSKKELLTFFHNAEVELNGELENVSAFSEAGEGGFETTKEKVFMIIN